jgi:hypothetical protein
MMIIYASTQSSSRSIEIDGGRRDNTRHLRLQCRPNVQDLPIHLKLKRTRRIGRPKSQSNVILDDLHAGGLQIECNVMRDPVVDADARVADDDEIVVREVRVLELGDVGIEAQDDLRTERQLDLGYWLPLNM